MTAAGGGPGHAGGGTGGAGAVPVVPAVVADAVAVLVFSIAGMNAHGTLMVELGRVAWPFAVAAAAGWAWTRAWRDPSRLWPVGVAVWFTTVALGMILRVATGGSFAVSFFLVTAAFLGVTMLGWRGMVAVIRRGTTARSTAAGRGGTDQEEAT
ncbi:DUF3054 domain-containing protein [Myceligenerans salitolerans]|uniref:DUF3054 domain-containing protein n=1 Tax=Myceligenerans salitolerans TaxID=1230528 RepID=A0ABS3I5X9_9MICO|nr:DUF3054 domain-containing protein [Myceligenerans salitolerans]MBO0607873.1 DUF3054 domain-containing protein [Myceligenerans salitolerans]